MNFEGGDKLLEKPEESARSDSPVRQTMVYRPGDGSARSVQNDMRDLGSSIGYYRMKTKGYGEKLFQLKAARNQIGLITDAREFVAHAGEAQGVDGMTIRLKVIGAPGHWLPGLSVFVRNRHAV